MFVYPNTPVAFRGITLSCTGFVHPMLAHVNPFIISGCEHARVVVFDDKHEKFAFFSDTLSCKKRAAEIKEQYFNAVVKQFIKDMEDKREEEEKDIIDYTAQYNATGRWKQKTMRTPDEYATIVRHSLELGKNISKSRFTKAVMENVTPEVYTAIWIDQFPTTWSEFTTLVQLPFYERVHKVLPTWGSLEGM